MNLALIPAALLVAAANGANDNFKGVATLYGSRTLGYRSSLLWGSLTVLIGGLLSVWLAPGLLAAFSGKGLVPDALVGAPQFVGAVAAATAVTVALAAWRGLPVSTTHALIGGLIGAGWIGGHGQIGWATLGASFLLPLLASPLLALLPALLLGRLTAPWLTRIEGARCLCATPSAIALPAGVAAFTAPGGLGLRLDRLEVCVQEGAVPLATVRTRRLVDAVHVLLGGSVGFARGLNDTPKIAALLLGADSLGAGPAVTLAALAMLVGGLLGARRVAQTLSHRVTTLDLAPALSGSFVTAILVTTASFSGLPVSTTHVAVGGLTGGGLGAGRRVDWNVLRSIALAWVVTLPVGAGFGALFYALL
jgi:Phosphate/sulphate permeases